MKTFDFIAVWLICGVILYTLAMVLNKLDRNSTQWKFNFPALLLFLSFGPLSPVLIFISHLHIYSLLRLFFYRKILPLKHLPKHINHKDHEVRKSILNRLQEGS